MLFMIIETFKDQDMVPVYRHVRDKGRQMPDGLKYIDSWVEPNFGRCFQLVEMRRSALAPALGLELARYRRVVRDRPRRPQ
ncbi:MAG: DUF3303 domain-containing protein [Rhodospirillaceae bacterium]